MQAKSIYLAKRNPLYSRESFPWRWRQHGLLGSSFPSLRAGNREVAQLANVFERELLPRSTLAYDGVALISHAKPEDAAGMWQNQDVIDYLIPDEVETFSTYVRHFTLSTFEELLDDRAPSQYCVVTFLKATRGVSRTRLSERLSELHLSLCSDPVVDAGRVVVNHVVDRPPGYDFDAVAEIWFADLASIAQLPVGVGGEFLVERAVVCDETRSITMVGKLNYTRNPSPE